MKKIYGIISALALTAVFATSVKLPTLAAEKAPEFSSGEYVDLLPYMKDTAYGKQKDDEDGIRMNLTKGAGGYTAKFNSQAINYGVRFNYDFVNPEGTLYYQCVLDAKQDLWDSDNARIYGGPIIQLAYGTVNDYKGYFSLLFTEKDGIDLRISDKIGNDLVYLGAIAGGLKVNYPDTKSGNRGTKDYMVIVKLTKKAITVWVDGVTVIDNVTFANLYSSSGDKINCEVERFDPGMHVNATRTTIRDFRLYCVKADAAGEAQNASTPSSGANDSTKGGVSDNKTSSDIKDSGKNPKAPTDNPDNNENPTDNPANGGDPTNEGNPVVDSNKGDSTDTPKDTNDKNMDYILVRGEKVEYFNWKLPVFISAAIIVALGTLTVVAYMFISKKRR